MESTVDDFFNEINEIAPPKPKLSKEKESAESVWQQCYDELTGYTYYWNTKSDEVTWNTPSNFKPAKSKLQKKDKTCVKQKKKEIYVPPRVSPLFPSITNASVKIYSIGENSKGTPESQPEPPKPQKRPHKKDSDSDEEKIELISSYGEDSSSESDEPEAKITKKDDHIEEAKKSNDKNDSDVDDDLDILAKIQKRAKELKEIGGDLPPEVTTAITEPVLPVPKPVPPPPKEKKKAISGFSLVAGYSDSEEEQENDEIKSIFPVPEPEPKVSHSTLFPITKPIDVKDFLQPAVTEKISRLSSDFDTKVFQRKRRIGVALVNTAKKKGDIEDTPDNERKGFGFNSQDVSSPKAKDNIYPGFKKGGVMFVKSDVLNPSMPKSDGPTEGKSADDESGAGREEVENMYGTVQEKLSFLSEGRPTVSPVQIMLIQAETLFTAVKEGGLKLFYLRRWLEETCSELVKLEKEAAPEGWLLQWDRSHKRYYYQNQTTGESQWEYPQPDVSRCDEAMDISTTPPSTEPTIRMSPPLPPVIRSPSPPPPPIISIRDDDDADAAPLPDVPLPPDQTPPAPKFTDNGEPLPPGVDLPEIMSYQKSEPKVADPLFSALDSFYSDLATIETTNRNPSPPQPPNMEETKPVESNVESAKKKKKAKVKLAPGLSMKKKGVSQLVEKWKSVQQHYND